MHGLVFVGSGAATVELVETFLLVVVERDPVPVRYVSVCEDEAVEEEVALSATVVSDVRPVVASMMVDVNVWYVPVAVAAALVFVPVRTVRAGSFVEMEGSSWAKTMSTLQKSTAKKAPKRLREAILGILGENQ